MSPKKKNGFFAFVCSLIPGAAEMYMGYMKLGISMMFAFVLVFMIAGFGFGNEVLLFLDIMIWFYSFFHARNLINTTEEEFQVIRDHYIWEEFIDGEIRIVNADGVRKVLAVVLIVVGLSMLWGQMESIIYAIIPDELWEFAYPMIRKIPQTVIAICIIVLGVFLIKGKKKEVQDGDANQNS